ncbi:hypothetical protein [Algibacillus agarilyticus]|uniref:hypothetical protein n=1 Tax=Algibacillus agarilyticus TaxID=2234133 RepID=UPI000DD05EBE|nr:hypothetical protein [Algibacillus agarilyticus]
MNKLSVILSIFLIASCASTYQSSDDLNAAIVEVLTPKSNLKLFAGSSTQNTRIGEIDSSGCLSNLAKVEMESFRNDGKLALPSGKEIGILVSATQDTKVCAVSAAVTLKPNAQYKVVFDMGYRGCSFNLLKLDGNKTSKVEFTKLRQGAFSHCKS